MKTILEIHNLADLTKDLPGLLDLIDDEVVRCKNAGDFLGAGEWLASIFPYVAEDRIEEIFSKIIVLWASPIELKILPHCIDDLTSKIGEFVQEEVAVALVATTLRLKRSHRSMPQKVKDLAFRLAKPISDLFEVETRQPTDLCVQAAAKLDIAISGLLSAVDSFLKTNCITAKSVSIDVVKKGHRLKKLALAQEKPILSELDILLGASFRKFCESSECQDIKGITKRATDLREQAQRSFSTLGHNNSTLWNLVVDQIGRHVVKIVDEACHHSELATTPSLKLASSIFKLDLNKLDKEMAFSCRLMNRGEGTALKIKVEPDISEIPIEIKILEPKGSFDIAGESEQIITFGVVLKEKKDRLGIPLIWRCETIDGRSHIESDTLTIEQQHLQPDWDKLMQNPPYTTNPIKNRENLFGRDAILNQLLLRASAGISTFIWGQKRVGKTSVLQVFATELQNKKDFVCIILRMGEIGALHEGQIAHTIAKRLVQKSNADIHMPNEQDFGAGLSRLIPFFENLINKLSKLKFVVIIDEFDDLNPAFYTGERGRLFVKALRSLSEIGLTFFFVGSERMNTIYTKHADDLNRWINVYLDCIESREDCRKLIIQPLKGAIEYQPECVDFIVDYCKGNPFYIHLLCSKLFERCCYEQRTYVSESDFYSVKQSLIRSLGETNFSHFWNDNPILDETEKVEHAAENYLVLSCISSLGGDYESIDDLYTTQENLDLGVSERLSSRDINTAVERLRNRRVLGPKYTGGKIEINLPIFKDWLIQYAELCILPKWREFCRKRTDKEVEKAHEFPTIIEANFPISEDELLTVSQYLVYHGKQKDVSELRLWLKQFDDDVRIEIAFLLLKRLAEKGFVTEGAKLQSLSTLEDALQAKRHKIGRGVWTIIKGKLDNLCITYIDSELKSGATTARELAKRLRSGKSGQFNTLSDWMKSHIDKDSLILIIDDFAGTGSTLLKGIEKSTKQASNDVVINRFLNEGRILCYLLYSFPEALQMLRKNYPKIEFFASHVFGEEVRALDIEAGIFDDEKEIKYAKDVLLQFGRELSPQYPLGYKDMGALIVFHNTVPNNTLPIFWCNGIVNDKPWKPLFPRA